MFDVSDESEKKKSGNVGGEVSRRRKGGRSETREENCGLTLFRLSFRSISAATKRPGERFGSEQ